MERPAPFTLIDTCSEKREIQSYFLFSPEPLPHRCPVCGALVVRLAKEEASAEHQHLMRIVATSYTRRCP
jgi:uncharacterized protein with PIN domain